MTAPLLTPEALRAAVADLGYELVDAQVSGPPTRRVVKLRIDRPGGSAPGQGVGADDCALVSRAVEQQLEAAGAVGPAWQLEVSSPGIERPVRFAEHWQRYAGRDVKVRVRGTTGARTGRIVGVPDDEHVTLALGGEEVTLALDTIRDATLVVDWSTLGNRAGDT